MFDLDLGEAGLDQAIDLVPVGAIDGERGGDLLRVLWVLEQRGTHVLGADGAEVGGVEDG